VVEQQTREGEVVSSNPTGRVGREFYAKNAVTSMAGGAGRTDGRWPVAGGGLPRKKKVCYYFLVFLHFHFAECKSLSSVFPALGKGFA